MSDLTVRVWRNAATDLSLAAGIDTLDAQQARRPLEVARTRLLVAAAIFMLCFVILGGRLVQLSVFGVNQEEKQIVAHETHMLALKRADIVDRNGTLIATNLPALPSLNKTSNCFLTISFILSTSSDVSFPFFVN